MALNGSEVVIAGSGNVYVAPVGTAFPSAFAAPGAGWSELGFLNEDGVQVTPALESTDIMAWQSMYAVRTSITSRSLTFTVTFLQWNEVILPLAMGGGTITGAGPYTFAPATSGTVDERAMLLHWIDGTKQYRMPLPRIMAVDLGAFSLNRSNAAGLTVGFRMLQPASGDPFDIITDDPAFA